jgi:hypothetical protein
MSGVISSTTRLPNLQVLKSFSKFENIWERLGYWCLESLSDNFSYIVITGLNGKGLL